MTFSRLENFSGVEELLKVQLRNKYGDGIDRDFARFSYQSSIVVRLLHLEIYGIIAYNINELLVCGKYLIFGQKFDRMRNHEISLNTRGLWLSVRSCRG